jgi:hypothetical protein
MSDHENCDRSEGVVGRAERRPVRFIARLSGPTSRRILGIFDEKERKNGGAAQAGQTRPQ